MPLKKLEDHVEPNIPTKVCAHPEHYMPMLMALKPGKYEYSCPACGEKRIFTIESLKL